MFEYYTAELLHGNKEPNRFCVHLLQSNSCESVWYLPNKFKDKAFLKT